MTLRYTLSYPDYVSHFLFLQFNVGVEHSKMELLHKRVQIQLNLTFSNGGNIA